MTWKSYAAVSGATVLAGWIASAPPSTAPIRAPSTSSRAPRATAPAQSDIEEQAIRLQVRLRHNREYTEPNRNPFRFAVREPVAVERSREFAPPAAAPAEPVLPPAPPVKLAGLAEDQVNGRLDRTAVLSSPNGVLLVREGDEILGAYRVVRIEAESIELQRLADGTSTRLTLK